MKILLAEYASALGLGGTHELEGRAMLSVLAASFQRAGHDVVYPTSGLAISAGRPILIRSEEELLSALEGSAEAGLVIAPDGFSRGSLSSWKRAWPTWEAAPLPPVSPQTSCSARRRCSGRALPWLRS